MIKNLNPIIKVPKINLKTWSNYLDTSRNKYIGEIVYVCQGENRCEDPDLNQSTCKSCLIIDTLDRRSSREILIEMLRVN